jgi:hypothetical protein
MNATSTLAAAPSLRPFADPTLRHGIDLTARVVLLGSAPEAVKIRDWSLPDNVILTCINNSYRVREDWQYLVYPGDFPAERLPREVNIPQALISERDYVPAMNAFGGIVYCGATMAYAAAYWAVHALRPRVLAFAACNMDYSQPGGATHFYGQGTPDPLREDATLQSLEAKSSRLFILALRQGSLVVNITGSHRSRLKIPSIDCDTFFGATCEELARAVERLQKEVNWFAVEEALIQEAELSYFAEAGDYWAPRYSFDRAKLAGIDAHWNAAGSSVPQGIFISQLSPK